MVTTQSQPLAPILGLVAQLRGSSRAGRASALKLLCALAQSPEMCTAISAVDGLMPALVAQLCDSSATVQRAAAGLLAFVTASSPEAQAAALAAGAMPRLVALIRDSSGGSGGNQGSRRSSSMSSNNRASGSMPSSSSSSDSVRLQALGAMHMLLQREQAGAALQAAGGIAPLVQLLRSTSASPKVLALAAAVLSDVPIGSDELAAAAIREGAFDALVPLLCSSDSQLQLHSAWACRNLACGDANKVAAAEAGCVPPLLRLLQDGSSSAQEEAAGALSNISAGGLRCAQGAA